MHGTDQPMLVGGVQFNGASIAERRNADQGHIVKMDDVVVAIVKDVRQRSTLKPGRSSLLGEQRGEESKPTP